MQPENELGKQGVSNDARDAQPANPVEVTKNKRNWNGLFGGFLIAVVAFSLGIAVGDGRISLGNSVSSTLPGQLDYSSVDQVYNVLKSDYDGKLDSAQLLAGLKEGLVEATGDPYTEYFTAKQAKEFDEQLNGNFSGIGAELGQDKDKNLIVVAPINGTPAQRAGLKSQDIIAEIDGQTASGLSVEEAVSKIRGPKGTEVKLTLIRDRSQTVKVTITRDDINVPSVEARTLDGNVGYIQVSTFSENSARLVEAEARKFRDAGVKGIVLDLRGNPGGLVEAAVNMSSLWLPKGKLILQEKRGDTVIKTHTANGNDILAGMPTTVLINGGSASASEIVAGALADNKAATLLGEKSYGKGSVQELNELADGGRVKITVARWYRPNGQNIDKKGIEPNQKVTISDEDAAAANDTQLEAARSGLAR